jgi:L,D-transpeptidase ErfK/SrfK
MGWPLRTFIVASLAALVAHGTGAAREPVRDGATVLTGSVRSHAVQPGDTLWSLGARSGVDAATIAADNGLPMDASLVVGRWLAVDSRHIVPEPIDAGALLVNIPQRILFHRADDGVTAAYPATVGRPSWPTPTGAFTITVKRERPSWHVPPAIREESWKRGRPLPAVVPAGPDNPLGAFWIGTTLSGIGIHGTNEPSSIFRLASHGCIRLHPDSIATLFPRVHVGTAGRFIYQPIMLAADEGEVYLEAHRDAYGRVAGDPRVAARALAAAAGLAARIDWRAADAVLAARHGVARRVTAGPPGAQP